MKNSKRIYIVEDTASVRESLCWHLKDLGFMVQGFEFAWSALEAIRKLQPDLVILDGKLPDMSGVEITKQLRREFPAIKVIAIPGDHDRSVWSEAKPDAIFPKPYNIGDLTTKVQDLVRVT